MSEFVLPAWLCLLMDWILFREPGMVTFNQPQNKTTGSVELNQLREVEFEV